MDDIHKNFTTSLKKEQFYLNLPCLVGDKNQKQSLNRY